MVLWISIASVYQYVQSYATQQLVHQRDISTPGQQTLHIIVMSSVVKYLIGCIADLGGKDLEYN